MICLTEGLDSAEREVLTPEACAFLTELHRRFQDRRCELLKARQARQAELNAGKLPDFLPETFDIRASQWKVAPIPKDLEDRRVEITGPVDRKMIINALNSGASVFMADFEDSNAPTWRNNIEGQRNLYDAVRRTITFTSPEGKQYKLNDKTAVLFVRPRGWHLAEKHFRVDGAAISGSLFDFGLYFFHNAKELSARGTAPYFYLPKMESHREARLWNDVFLFAQDYLGIQRGTIRATVLIETIFGAFEMDEILYELCEHSAGLNCGRWDYIFSFIKKLGGHSQFTLPNRAQVTMDRAFLKAYVELLIQTCHKRGIHAMGGMAAQIPIKENAEANEMALHKVRQDKLREVKAGHDGTWVAHPGLVPVAKAVFDEHMKGPNQLDRKRDDVWVTQKDLLQIHEGEITEQGLRTNVEVGLRYIESWLLGNGCVPIHNLMEDLATAEICRAQLWQWVKHRAKLEDGREITPELFGEIADEEFDKIMQGLGPEKFYTRRFVEASEIMEDLVTREEFCEFLPNEAYQYID
jgi:malate synthase